MLPHTTRVLLPRRAPIMLICCALAAVLLVLSGPRAARAESKPAITAPASVPSGSSVLLTLAPGHRLQSGARLERRFHGTETWRRAGSLPFVVGKGYRVRTGPLLRSTDFRVVTRSGPTLGAVVTVRVRDALRLEGQPASQLMAGDRVRLVAATTPGLVGARVDLERADAGGWRRVATTTVGPEGRVMVEAVATAAGEQAYRIRVPQAGGRAEVVSEIRNFVVSAWYRLASLTPLPQSDPTAQVLTAGSRRLDGVPYEQSLGLTIRGGSSASVGFALRSTCSAFRSAIGLSEDSDPGFTAKQVVLADDAVVARTATAGGSGAVLEAPIDGADLLELRSFAFDGNGGADWGNPEVLCSGRP